MMVSASFLGVFQESIKCDQIQVPFVKVTSAEETGREEGFDWPRLVLLQYRSYNCSCVSIMIFISLTLCKLVVIMIMSILSVVYATSTQEPFI